MFRICKNTIEFRTIILNYSGNVFFNPDSRHFLYQRLPVQGRKNKMGVKIMVFYFHNDGPSTQINASVSDEGCRSSYDFPDSFPGLGVRIP